MGTSDRPAIISIVVSATRLDQSHAGLIARFLERDTNAHVFALGALEQWGVEGNSGVEWWGHIGGSGELDALVFAEGHRAGLGHSLVVPMGCPEAILSMAEAVAGRDGAAWMVGERHAADALGGALADEVPLLKRRQLLMALESVRAGPSITIRQALLGDLEWVLEAVRAVNQEDLGLDLLDLNGPTLVRKVEASIVSGVEWLGAGRVYRAKVGTLGQHGAQLGGVWVPPSHRGRGLGQMGTRALCERLLREVPLITLHVDAENHRARRCYEAVGFRTIRDFQLWVR